MRGFAIAAVSLALGFAAPGAAVAQDAMSAGVLTGALTGGLVAGPIGAIVGGVAGAAIGRAVDERAPPRVRTVRARRARYAGAAPREAAPLPSRYAAGTVVQRTCVQDRAGNRTCRETVR